MQFSHLFFPQYATFFCLKKLYNIKKRTKKEPLILLHETFRIWIYPNMRYKATPQGQTASYSILLCHQEEKWGTERKKTKEQKKLYSLKKRKKKIPLVTLPAPECYSIIHQHNRNTEMINAVTALLTGHKDREKSRGGLQGEETPVPTPSLPLLSNNNKSVFSLLSQKHFSRPF